LPNRPSGLALILQHDDIHDFRVHEFGPFLGIFIDHRELLASESSIVLREDRGLIGIGRSYRNFCC
jgi:hypothetical protein